MNTNGHVTSLVSFNVMNGASPIAELLPDSDGTFYGTTAYGGSSGNDQVGTIFKLQPAVNPVIEQTAIQPVYDGLSLTFKWQALAGVFYGFQYTSTLNPPTWADVSDWYYSPTNGLAPADPLFFSAWPFTIEPDQQRFFRVVVLPP